MSSTTFSCRKLLTPGGWKHDVIMRIDRAGRIEALDERASALADTTLHGPVIPGMPNCHSHAFQRQMAGLAGRAAASGEDGFWTWRDAMYRLAGRIGPEQLEAIARWLYIEMLEAGYTSCAEFHYLHHDAAGANYAEPDEMAGRLLNAASQAGIALTVLPVLYCRAGFDEEGVQAGQRRFANDPESFLRLFAACRERIKSHGGLSLGFALHSLRAVSPRQMTTVIDAIGHEAAAIHIHVAEQQAEVDQCLAAHGARPVEWLLDHAPVDDHWCLVHATHMTPAENRTAAASGAVAGLCPTTEADLGDGFFEAAAWLENGGAIAIGSDSNLRVCPREELRLLEFGQRLRSGRRNVLAPPGGHCGQALYTLAAHGGASALGQAVGRLAPGFRADWLELDPDHPLLHGVEEADIVDRFIFADESSMIRSVFVGGQQRVEGGKHPGREAAAAAFAAVMEDL